VADALAADDSGGATVLYTVGSPQTPTTTIALAHPGPAPAVTHQPLPLTGAPVVLELVGSLGLLLAGTIAALIARYGPSRRVPGRPTRT
jgi:hypothetical protein